MCPRTPSRHAWKQVSTRETFRSMRCGGPTQGAWTTCTALSIEASCACAAATCRPSAHDDECSKQAACRPNPIPSCNRDTHQGNQESHHSEGKVRVPTTACGRGGLPQQARSARLLPVLLSSDRVESATQNGERRDTLKRWLATFSVHVPLLVSASVSASREQAAFVRHAFPEEPLPEEGCLAEAIDEARQDERRGPPCSPGDLEADGVRGDQHVAQSGNPRGAPLPLGGIRQSLGTGAFATGAKALCVPANSKRAAAWR